MLALFAAAAAAAALAVTWLAALTPWLGPGGWPAVALVGILALAAWFAPRLGAGSTRALAAAAGLLGGVLGWAAAAGLLAPVIAATGGSPVMNSVTLSVLPAVLTSVVLGELGRRVATPGALAAGGLGGLVGALLAILALHPTVGLSPTAIGAAAGFTAAAFVGLRNPSSFAAGPGVSAALAACLLGALLPGLLTSDGPDADSWRARRDAGAAAHLGVFLHGAPTRALLIAEGAALEVERAALESHADLTDRTVVSPDRARALLLADGPAYDLVVAPAPDAWPTAATVQFYRLVADRLAPGGLFVQPLPLQRLTRRDVRRRLAALNAAFGAGQLFHDPGGSPVVVYGARPRVDLADWALRGALPEVRASLADLGIRSPYRLLAGWSLDSDALTDAADGALASRDNRPWAKLRPSAAALPADLVGDPFDLLGLLEEWDWTRPELLDEVPGLRDSVEAVSAAREASGLAYMSPPAWRELIYGTALQPALHAVPDDPGVMHLLGLGPDAPEDAWTGARRAYYQGRYAEALAALEALPEDDDPALRWLLIGGCRRALGEHEAAGVAFAAAAEASDHEKLRELLTVMSVRAAAPWSEVAGPLAGPQ